ncbi:MAG: hypothetical protein U1F77_15790 [Kiritimatiellia bacterium]
MIRSRGRRRASRNPLLGRHDTTADADGGAGAWDTATLNWDNAALAGTATARSSTSADAA